MSTVGFGPLEAIDGPPPIPPVYGLLATAEAALAGVRFVPDSGSSDRERWLNGAEVRPYPPGLAEVIDVCAVGSDARAKGFGDESIPLPQFAAMTIHVPITCTAHQVPDDDAFKARAVAALSAVESASVEREFLTGDELPLNPHLSDGNGTFPNLDVATSPQNGLALLEAEIAKSGRQGVIHVDPKTATFLRDHWAIDNSSGIYRTANGIVVVNGFGYVDGATPDDGHAAPGATAEWIYATGPIDIYRSDVFTVPQTRAEAMDRGSGGATMGRPNSVTYRAERYYLVIWDTVVQAAVLVDRCQDTC